MSGSRVFKKPEAKQPGFSSLNHNVVQLLAGKFLSIQEAGRFSRSCQLLWRQVKPVLNMKELQKFLLAVVDDDYITVRALLKNNPWLLLVEPCKNLVIESQFTWQRFYAENALSMAVKRRQSAMVKLLLPYYDRLIKQCGTAEEKEWILNAKIQALSTWTEYEEVEQDGETEFVIPGFYRDFIQHLINLYLQEDYRDNKLSPATEAALTQFFNMLLPEQAVKLDDYFDIDLLCYAASKMICEQPGGLGSWIRPNHINIRVVGLIQSMSTPKTATILCEGIYDVLNHNKPLGNYAESLTLDDGQPFYRSSRDSRSGLGFDYCVRGRHNIGAEALILFGYRKLLAEKNSFRRQVMQSLASNQIHHRSTGCVIL